MTRLTAVPLFPEPAMSTTARIPLGAPPAYRRVVLDRAGGQCECAGQCGVTHAKTANRCPRKHGGWHAHKETVLLLTPRVPLTPVVVAAALPDAELMASCDDCLRRAERLAKAP